jgi:alternate signal-mediated exported protein
MTAQTISRKTKGTVAAVAGAGLLLTTGGTFAYWEAVADLEGNTITAGSLGLTATSISWDYTYNNTTWTEVDQVTGGFLMVPGHTVRGEFTVDATIEGTDLVANLVIGEEGGVPTGIPGAVVTWYQQDGDNWAAVPVTAQTSPYEIATGLDEAAEYTFRVEIELPFEGLDNSSNSFGRQTPYQWTLADAHLSVVQLAPGT